MAKKGGEEKRKASAGVDQDVPSAPEGEEEGVDATEGGEMEPTGQEEGKEEVEDSPSSEDEAPEDMLWVRGKDQALEQKRSEAAAAKRLEVCVQK